VSALSFSDALAALRNGADYSLCGSTLTVNGIAMAITDDQFEQAWDVLDEIECEDYTVRLAR
jgi:hypothetical protein